MQTQQKLQPETWLPLTCTFAQPSPGALSKVQSPPYPGAAQGLDQGREKQNLRVFPKQRKQRGRAGGGVGTRAEALQDRNLMQKRAASVSKVSAAYQEVHNFSGGEREA